MFKSEAGTISTHRSKLGVVFGSLQVEDHEFSLRGDSFVLRTHGRAKIRAGDHLGIVFLEGSVPPVVVAWWNHSRQAGTSVAALLLREALYWVVAGAGIVGGALFVYSGGDPRYPLTGPLLIAGGLLAAPMIRRSRKIRNLFATVKRSHG